jgi:preprotein translocase subunit Sec61beta
MAKDNRINLPSSGAGLTRYFDNEQSKVMISPQTTIIIILAVIVVVLLLTSF